MKDYMYKATISAATVLEEPLVATGRQRHQIDCSGTTGTLQIEIDFGTGYRTVTTLDLTDLARVPFCIEASIEKIRLTPSAEVLIAYFVDEVS